MIHAYCLAPQMNQLLMDATHKEQLTEGRAFPSPMDPQRRLVPSNYQICFLTTTLRLPSGIIVAKVNRLMARYMSGATERN